MKYFAIAKIVNPVAVQTQATTFGFTAHKGAIFVECPELGFEGGDLLYSRYGMAIPYIRVQENDTIWIEPTIGTKERFVYIGFADCAGTVIPATGDELVITLATNVTVKITNTPKRLLLDVNGVKFQIDETGRKVTVVCDELLLGSGSVTEAFLKGTAFDTWITSTLKTIFDAHTHAGVTAGVALTGITATPLTAPTGHLSTKIKGE